MKGATKRSAKRLQVLLIFIVPLLLSTNVYAHKFAPSLLRMFEIGPNEYNVVWKTPAQLGSNVPLLPKFPEHCNISGRTDAQLEGTGVIHNLQLLCSQTLINHEITVSGLVENSASVLFSIQMLDKTFYQSLLNSNKSTFIIPSEPDSLKVILQYSWLGAEHIWGGIDHLLFVFGLLLLVNGGKRLVYTITAFTLGHSITLSLVTLGYLEYPVALLEFTIALSIFILAVELTRTDEGGLFKRYPWWLAGGFGLLHGMGFAGALAEVGLPQQAVPLALLFFNIGIELGQLAFIFALISIYMIAGKIIKGKNQSAPTNALSSQRWQTVPVYLLGALSAMWCIERGLEVLS